MLSPYKVLRSSMDPPVWMVITATNYSSGSHYVPVRVRDDSDLPTEKKPKNPDIQTYLWHNNELRLYRRLTDACKACNNKLQGSSFQRFRDSGCHRFKNGAVVFLDIEKVPEKIRVAIKEKAGDEFNS